MNSDSQLLAYKFCQSAAGFPTLPFGCELSNYLYQAAAGHQILQVSSGISNFACGGKKL
jgi:hypothetical protein